MIKLRDWLMITGSGTIVALGYNNMTGWFYKGELKDAPPLDADLEVVSQYVMDDNVLRVVFK